MASFNDPKLSNHIADDVPAIRQLLRSLAAFDPATGNTDIPNGAKRLIETAQGYEFQSYNGTAWVTLEKWNIDVQKVDGYSASTGTTANTIPVRDANGKLPGDITGNAASADEAEALSATNPIDKGGTGATTAAQARANLGTPPKAHASTSTEYGAGTSTQYGHLKSHDEPDATLTAATGHAFSPAGAASLKGEIDGKLSTSGGTITGALEMNAPIYTTTGAGQPAINTPSNSQIYFLDNGDMIFRPLGDYTKDLTLWNNGALTLCGNSVLTSAGGAITGVVRQSAGDIMTAARDDMWTSIKGGSGHNHGAALTLYGQDHGGGGHAELIAYKEGVGAATLSLSPTGVAVIGGNTVLTSAGGTITGSLLVPVILSGDNDGIELYGGNAWRTGGYIELGGPNHTHPNHVQINGGSRQVLEDVGSGWHINGSPIVTITSSWRSGNDWYRKYSDGFIEQGGEIWVSGTGNHAIPLNTPFTHTVYTAVTSQAALGSSGGEWVNGQAITGRATTHFNVYDVHSGGHTILWYACGN